MSYSFRKSILYTYINVYYVQLLISLLHITALCTATANGNTCSFKKFQARHQEGGQDATQVEWALYS